MPILDLADAKPLFPKPEPRRGKRDLGPATAPALYGGGGGAGGFAAAKINRLTMDFIGTPRSADQDLYSDNIRLRARARKLAIDTPFARKFLAMVVQNVVGPAGVLLQAKIVNANGKATAQTKQINRRIEEEWKRWGKAGRCTADGRFSFAELQQMAIKNAAREGENLVKLVYGRQFNDTGLALQPLDNDQLDDMMMVATDNGGSIRMGVESDRYLRPVAYWLWAGHPYDILPGSRERVRVPADLVVHTAVWERPAQSRGYSWMTAAILQMNHYDRYQEAVIVASRASAAKFMVIQKAAAEGLYGDDADEAGGTNPPTNDPSQQMSANSGEALVLDPGEVANFIDPRFPNAEFAGFTKTILRNIASGLLVSYPSLANDLEGVNFSSIRAGLLDERDGWRILQRWFIDHFLEPIFQKWLSAALLTTLSDITLSPAQRDMIVWKSRGWEWVDPLKDAQAMVLKLQNGLITYADALASLGLDFEETMTERAREQAFIEALGVVLGTDIRGVADSADDGTTAPSNKNNTDANAPAQDGGNDGSKPAAPKPAAKPGAPKPTRQIDRIARALDLLAEMKEARP